MERFIQTKFFNLLETSPKSIDININVLKKEYAEFARLIFSERAAFVDKEAYLEILFYTRVELCSLMEVSREKYGGLSAQDHCFDRSADRMDKAL